MKVWAVIGVILVVAALVKAPALIDDVTKFLRDLHDTI